MSRIYLYDKYKDEQERRKKRESKRFHVHIIDRYGISENIRTDWRLRVDLAVSWYRWNKARRIEVFDQDAKNPA